MTASKYFTIALKANSPLKTSSMHKLWFPVTLTASPKNLEF
jgi:hypothetical protein